MDLRKPVLDAIEQLGKDAAKFFEVTPQKLGTWKKNPKLIPLDAIDKVYDAFEIGVEADPPTPSATAEEEAPEIREPESAPPASGRVPPARSIPHMTMPPARPSGSPMVVPPRTGNVRHIGATGGSAGAPVTGAIAPRKPGEMARAPGNDPGGVAQIAASVTALLAAQGITDPAIVSAAVAGALQGGGGGLPPGVDMVELPAGNLMDSIGENEAFQDKTWNMSHRQIEAHEAEVAEIQREQRQEQRRMVLRRKAEA